MDRVIGNHEISALNMFGEVADSYTKKFAKYNCKIKVTLIWRNFLDDTISSRRLPFINGYACYVYCEIQRRGKTVRFADDEEEVSYFEMAFSLNISSITREFWKLNVTLVNEIEDASIAEITKNLEWYLDILSTSVDRI